MRRALLLGREPGTDLGMEYVSEPPYDAVVIGSLTPGQLLCFREEAVLDALIRGLPVYLYTPGLPDGGKSRALGAALASAQRMLKSWGVIFTDGAQKRLITAQQAKLLRQNGQKPPPGCTLTPLARDILEGSE